MDVKDAIRERRSVRRYRPEGVPEEVLRRLFDLVRLAPSGGNRQPWRFIIVREGETKRRIAEVGEPFIAEAPVLVVACGDSRARRYLLHLGIALDHLTLAAVDMGLGTCWIGAFREERVKEILSIPEDVGIFLMTLGYPVSWPPAKPRKPLSEIISYERYEPITVVGTERG